MVLLGTIEAGGTKFVCAVGNDVSDLSTSIRIPTTTPVATIERVINFFHKQSLRHGELAAIGIGAFGPVDARTGSEKFGWFLNTPKPGWQQIDFVGALRREFSVPIGFDTDVNAAALGEYQWGHGQGFETFLYLTVGTGIGGGAIVSGKPLHGLLHPEMGHILIPHDRVADPFEGCCPFHGDCLEGLASGVAIAKRWNCQPADLPPDHPAWQLEAHYLAVGIVNLVLTFSPERIILGGGVMEQTHLFEMIRLEVCDRLSPYVEIPNILDDIDGYIVPPKLGNQSGIMGGFAIAHQALSAI
ncbi:MAG: ROK family protein [Cyanobacteria bacterium P01_D01_bin.1]